MSAQAGHEHADELSSFEEDLLDTSAAGPAAIRGGALRTGGYIAGTALSIVAVPLLIRHLGAAGYGRYVTVVSLVTIVQGITDIGLGQIGVREYAVRSGPDSARLMGNLLGVRLALTFLGVLGATAFAALVGYSHAVLLGTFLAGIGMLLTVAQGTFVVPLASQLRLGWVSALELLRQVLGVAAIVVLVLAGATLLPFLAVMVPVALVVLAVTVLLVRGMVPLRPSFERAEWSSLLRAVLPFAAAVVVGSLYLRITVVLLSLLSTAKQTGYYATSFTVISVLIAIPALAVGSTLPVLARAARDDRERLDYVLQRLVEVTLMAGVGIGLTLALGAGFVVRVLTGGGGPSVTVLQIESIAIVTLFVGSALQYGLLAMHRHRSLLLISGCGLLTSVVLSVALAPGLQARGAAIAFSGAELIVVAATFVFLRTARPELRFALGVPVKIVIAAALAVGVALVTGLGSLPQALIGISVYGVVLLISGAVPKELLQAVPRRAAPGSR